MPELSSAMPLDEKALEAAREEPGTNHDRIIRAYLSSLTPSVGEMIREAEEHVQLAKSMGNFGVASQTVEKLAASLTSLSAEVARKDAEIERLRGRLRLAEVMMTKDSLCEAERLEEGLHCVRAALSAPKGDEHV